MLSFAGSLKVFVALDPCDLRKSFDGLHTLVTERLRATPQTGALFVAKLSLTPEALTLLTDGVDLRDAKLRPWYQRE
jgi:transposase